MGSVKIIHPYHPRYGQTYDVLKVKKVNDFLRYSLRVDSGTLCVPESWTDRQIQQNWELHSQLLPFDAFTLYELAQFLHTLDENSK